MKKGAVVFMMAYCILQVSGASHYRLTREHNMMRDGDDVRKVEISYCKPGEEGEGRFWDFSQIEAVDEVQRVRYFSPNDTLYAVIEGRTQFRYFFLNDTLWSTGYENRTTVFRDSIPEIVMAYPFAYGGRLSGSFRWTGRYAEDRDAVTEGETTVGADGIGQMLLPTLDTLHNVLRVRTDRHVWLRLLTVQETPESPLQRDSVTSYRQTTYHWYAEGYRYPVVETTEYEFFEAGEPVGTWKGSFYIAPDEQIYLPADEANEPLREAQRRASAGLPMKSGPGQGAGGANHGFDAETGGIAGSLAASDMVVRETGTGIAVDFTVGTATEVEITLADMAGRVYWHVPKRVLYPGSYSESTVGIDLVPGDYLLSVLAGGIRTNRKILKH